MHPQQRFLHHVLGLGDATQHPVGDRERHRPQLVKQPLALAHAANPCCLAATSVFTSTQSPVAPSTKTLIIHPFESKTPRPKDRTATRSVTHPGTPQGIRPTAVEAVATSSGITASGHGRPDVVRCSPSSARRPIRCLRLGGRRRSATGPL